MRHVSLKVLILPIIPLTQLPDQRAAGCVMLFVHIKSSPILRGMFVVGHFPGVISGAVYSHTAGVSVGVARYADIDSPHAFDPVLLANSLSFF